MACRHNLKCTLKLSHKYVCKNLKKNQLYVMINQIFLIEIESRWDWFYWFLHGTGRELRKYKWSDPDTTLSFYTGRVLGPEISARANISNAITSVKKRVKNNFAYARGKFINSFLSRAKEGSAWMTLPPCTHRWNHKSSGEDIPVGPLHFC